MSDVGSAQFYADLIRNLIQQPAETEWLEFKLNRKPPPEEVGQYISGLSNSAALSGERYGYVVWGVSDEDHSVVGTTFAPATCKKGNEQLEPWLARLLEPRLNFSFHQVQVDGKQLVVLEVPRAEGQPTRFAGEEYVRVGSALQKLRHNVEKERALWDVFNSRPFEKRIALSGVTDFQVTQLLDSASYFRLLDTQQPEQLSETLRIFEADKLIRKSSAGNWDVTNLGAVLFAHRLNDFELLERKAIRVIQYAGEDRTETRREQMGT